MHEYMDRLALLALTNSAVFALAAWIYARGLIWAGNRLWRPLSHVVALVLYLSFALLVVGSLIVVLDPSLEPWWLPLVVWAGSMAPGFWVIRRHIGQLREAGFFKPWKP